MRKSNKINKKNKTRVMMLGTDFKGKGGIASVVRGFYCSGIMERLNIDYYPTHCEGRGLTKIKFYINNLIKILFKISRYKIIHIHLASKWSFRRLLPILFLAYLTNKKKVIHLHGAAFDIYYRNTSFSEKKLIELAFSGTERVIVLSEEWKKKVTTFCDEKKIIIIPNSVPLMPEKKYMSILLSKKARIILFLGEIGFRKGVYDLIEAISYIEKQANIMVFICGPGNIQKALNKIKKLKLEQKVKLISWVGGKEKENLLKEAYLYILPSYYEGLPMSILEAMAAGIPVISTKVGGIPEIVKDGINGYIIPPGSPRLIAERIKIIIENPSIWEKMAKNAHNTIKTKFCLSKTEKKIGNLYESLIFLK